MADIQKLVLMVQPSRLQGLIWQTVLRSQGLSVLWEPPDIALQENLMQLKNAGLPLPDLLLVDISLPNFNAASFSRWCRDTCPQVKLLLVNAAQTEVSAAERQGAVYQGAADLLPGFQQDNLVISVSQGVQRVLKVLNAPLDNSALISVLLTIKRKLDAQRLTDLDDTSALGGAIAPGLEGGLPPQKSVTETRNGNGKPAVRELPKPNSLPPNRKPPNDEPPPARKYRGRAY